MKDSQLEDSQLMVAYAQGNAQAFNTLYGRHKQALYRFFRNSCDSEAQAQELYQDVWLRVIKSRNTYTQDAPFNAWLFRIARNRLTDHYRQQPAMAELGVDSEAQSSQLAGWVTRPLTPEEMTHLSERADTLYSALKQLSAPQREAVLLRHIANMSVKEVASVVNEGVETVKSRLRYATVRLRSLLQGLS